MAWDDFKEMSNWDSSGNDMDDFERQQLRSAAKDLYQGFKIGHEQTSWTEEESFIECVSNGLFQPIKRVGELAVDNKLLTDELSEMQKTLQWKLGVQNEAEALVQSLREEVSRLKVIEDAAYQIERSWDRNTPTADRVSVPDRLMQKLISALFDQDSDSEKS